MNDKIDIFRDEPAFPKLFKLFKEKYRSLGRVGGTVSLRSFNQLEAESIAGFLGRSTESLLQKGSLSLLDFEKELTNTGFSEYTLIQLLEEVLGESIYSKKEELAQFQQQERLFIDSLQQIIPTANWWLQWINSKTSDTRWIWSLYSQDKESLYEKVILVFKAFNTLQNKGTIERLPFFSQRTTGNPHFFDMNEITGKLLLHCMYIDQKLRGNIDATMPKTTEEINDLLAEYGIMRDDLWNFVTCQGLFAEWENSIHPVWQAAIDTKTVMNVPMKELAKLERIWPAVGTKVWIVENSSVCSMIMDAVPDAPVICTHGQLRMASWLLLDRLVQSHCTLFYSGDLDPEGIVIAERLKKRYKDQVIFWRMDKESYTTSQSKEDISNRLSKLDRVNSPEWQELITLMKDTKMAGYQEAIVGKLIQDIIYDSSN